jgi:hypothetical protein
MKSTRNKRRDVTLGEKFQLLAMAMKEMECRPETKFKTDLIGIACQFSSQPKLKRKDFQGIIDYSIKDIAYILNINVKDDNETL